MTYDYRTLSPADFEDLTRDLLGAEWGVSLECFKTGRDDGIDLRHFSCSRGSIVVQCKHYAGSGFRKLLSHLARIELPKILRLDPARYILVTSVALSPRNKAAIKATLAPVRVADGDIIGATEVGALLRKHPEVEKANMKLWLTSTAVMQRVLHNAEHVQTDFHVEKVRERIRLYVRNGSFPAALAILKREHVVVVSGSPGIGKTTLADLLLFAHLEQGYRPVVVKGDITEAKRLFDRSVKQIFYYDDFLGRTFLGDRSDFLGRREDGAIVEFLEMVAQSKSSKFILTTRDHLLQSAFRLSERFERERKLFQSRRCVLDVKGYGGMDRARILYNHVHFSDLPAGLKKALVGDAFYLEILRHENFNPRLVEWMSRYVNVRAGGQRRFRDTVRHVLANPEQLWRGAFEREISEPSRSVLLALYSLGGDALLDDLEPAWRALHRHRATQHGLQTSAEDWMSSLQELEGGFLALPDRRAQFANPSVKDFLEATIGENPEHGMELIASAGVFRQLLSLWQLARSAKGRGLRERLGRESDALLGSVRRLLAAPVRRITTHGRGRAEIAIDISLERRLVMLVEVGAELSNPGFLAAAADLVQMVGRSWLAGQPDFRSAAAFLRASSGNVGREMGSLRKAVGKSLVASLERQPVLEGFECLMMETWAAGAHVPTKGEMAVLSTAFEDYLADRFDDDVASADGEGEHEELAGKLAGVSDWLDVPCEPQRQRLAEILAGFKEAEEAEAEDIADHAPKVTPSGVDEESEIRHLFDGLAV